jgi:trehalose 6-phosphate phosphatase
LQSIGKEPRLGESDTLPEFFGRLSEAWASALLLDYDGTLAPFHIDRHRAYPYPRVLPLIERILQTEKTRVIIITGRPAVEAKALLNPLHDLEIWGAHGMEHILPDGSYRRISIDVQTVELLLQAKQQVIERGLERLAEFKPGGVAIHWRGLPDAEAGKVEARIRTGWTALAKSPRLKLLKFESGLELRVAHPDKGDAVAAIIEESDPDTQIAYLGDDLTDEDSFRALNDRGLTVLVRPEHRETSAKVWLKPPLELIGFLEQWLSRISA